MTVPLRRVKELLTGSQKEAESDHLAKLIITKTIKMISAPEALTKLPVTLQLWPTPKTMF
jgi:hypothetical protein